MSASNEQRIPLSHPVVESSERGAKELADAYWNEIRRITMGLVCARATTGGTELALVGALSLLRFGEPEISATADRVECRFPIIGGALAKQSGGSLTIAQQSGSSPELVVTVEDYAPRLDSGRPRGGARTLAYRRLQQPVHAAIGERYLNRMAARSR